MATTSNRRACQRWRVFVALALAGAGQPVRADPGAWAVFSHPLYAAHNTLDRTDPVRRGQYRNPIIPGFHPDPSVVRVGRDYYLVNSSFAYFPGLPVFHSRDLVNWAQIGNAIDRPDMVYFQGLGVARAIFAPTLRYHRGRFVIITTCVDCGGTFIMTAHNPSGPWSRPRFLPSVDGIDPDIFFDDDGRVWITNNGPPEGPARYDGHRALWIQQFDDVRQRMVGKRTVLVDGGVRPETRPIWTEGPHIFRKDGYVYLIAAEGGTAANHSETVYRARSVTGPYEPAPINPILTQRDLDPARANPVQATGHADFVRTPAGDWWAVFLGTRPYRDMLANPGRETFLLPVTWQAGWPQILPPHSVVAQAVPRPRLAPVAERAPRPRRARPSPDWIMLRTPKTRWFRVLPSGAMAVEPGTDSLTSKGNPAFIGKRQTERVETVTVDLAYAPAHNGDHAGLAAFADEDHFVTFGLWQTAQGRALIVQRRNGSGEPAEGVPLATIALPPAQSHVRLRLNIADPVHSYQYALGTGGWHTALAELDSSFLASERSNQFTGTVIGLYANRGQR